LLLSPLKPIEGLNGAPVFFFWENRKSPFDSLRSLRAGSPLRAPVGAMGQSNADEEKPSLGDIETAERLGARVAVITRRLKNGVPFETERLPEPEFPKRNIARRDALAGR
jgi:hypothetical protein